MALSPMDVLNNIRSKAKLEDNFEKQVVMRLNKEGKLKLQLLAPDQDHLFKARTQHFIPTLPGEEDPNEKGIVINCLGSDCPVCEALNTLRHSNVTVDALNEAYNPKYPYTKLRSAFTYPEHFLIAARVIEDGNKFLPKDENLGDVQIVQFSRSALNSLLHAYEDMLDDNEDDYDSLPPLFGITENNDTVKSLMVTLRIQTQPWSYSFTFNTKGVECDLTEVNKTERLEQITNDTMPNEDYVEKAVSRVNEIKNYFNNQGSVKSTGVSSTMNSRPHSQEKSDSKSSTEEPSIDDILDTDLDDFDIDSL